LWIAVVGAIKPQPLQVWRHRAPTRPAPAGLFIRRHPCPARAARTRRRHAPDSQPSDHARGGGRWWGPEKLETWKPGRATAWFGIAAC